LTFSYSLFAIRFWLTLCGFAALREKIYWLLAFDFWLTIQQLNDSTIKHLNDKTIQQLNDSTIKQFNICSA